QDDREALLGAGRRGLRFLVAATLRRPPRTDPHSRTRRLSMAAARLPLALATLLTLLSAAPAGAATFTVTSTADAGAGTLRQAILDANASEGVDRIEFAIPAEACSAAGVCRIELEAALPALEDGVAIDATTQPRHGTAAENVCATQTAPSSLRVELVGYYGGHGPAALPRILT